MQFIISSLVTRWHEKKLCVPSLLVKRCGGKTSLGWVGDVHRIRHWRHGHNAKAISAAIIIAQTRNFIDKVLIDLFIQLILQLQRTRSHIHTHSHTHTLSLSPPLSLCLSVSLSYTHTHTHTHIWKTGPLPGTEWKFYFQNIYIPLKTFPRNEIEQNYGNWILLHYFKNISIPWKRSNCFSDTCITRPTTRSWFSQNIIFNAFSLGSKFKF